jgi:hypothetical protein
MIGQQADALLVGDAKQRSALYAFLRDIAARRSWRRRRRRPLYVLLEGGVLFDSSASARCRSGAAVSVGALHADVGSRAQQLQALLARAKSRALKK